MPSYEVIKPCYVPLGRGLKYSAVGRVVTLEAEQAEKLDGYVRPIDQESVRFPDSEPAWIPDAEVTPEATMDEEVVQGVGDPQADHE